MPSYWEGGEFVNDHLGRSVWSKIFLLFLFALLASLLLRFFPLLTDFPLFPLVTFHRLRNVQTFNYNLDFRLIDDPEPDTAITEFEFWRNLVWFSD